MLRLGALWLSFGVFRLLQVLGDGWRFVAIGALFLLSARAVGAVT
jgi:hypothetical protein